MNTDSVKVHNLVGYGAGEGERRRVQQLSGLAAGCDDSARHGGRGEQPEQKPARKTMAKKRSSSSPRPSRSTPMIHKKAMPANGTRFSARANVFDLVLSHAPVSSGSARTESRSSKRLIIRKYRKRMPAMAPRAASSRARGSRLLPASSDIDNYRWQLPSDSLIDVTRWQSPCSNPFVENFLLQRKGDPFLRRIWIGPQAAKLQENFLFVLCHPLALE
jgi:hypothetical protein